MYLHCNVPLLIVTSDLSSEEALSVFNKHDFNFSLKLNKILALVSNKVVNSPNSFSLFAMAFPRAVRPLPRSLQKVADPCIKI